MGIEIPKREPCPYCENFAGRYASHGPPAVIVEDETVMVFLNPASLGGMEGHTLVIPKRHVETFFDLTPEEEVELIRWVGRAARALRTTLDLDGLLIQQRNGVAADQTVAHVHFHVIPRRAGVPFPPTEWVEVTPNEERVRLAQLILSHWPDRERSPEAKPKSE